MVKSVRCAPPTFICVHPNACVNNVVQMEVMCHFTCRDAMRRLNSCPCRDFVCRSGLSHALREQWPWLELVSCSQASGIFAVALSRSGEVHVCMGAYRRGCAEFRDTKQICFAAHAWRTWARHMGFTHAHGTWTGWIPGLGHVLRSPLGMPVEHICRTDSPLKRKGCTQ